MCIRCVLEHVLDILDVYIIHVVIVHLIMYCQHFCGQGQEVILETHNDMDKSCCYLKAILNVGELCLYVFFFC